MPNYRVKEIHTIQDFVNLVDEEKAIAEKKGNNTDFIFRGQRRDLDLLPKLKRLKLRGTINEIEKLIIEEFQRTSLPLSEFNPNDKWNILALAQHHGLPTRLLDWTYNALAGLWFAVRKPAHKSEDGTKENGVVWILIPNLSDYYEIDTEQLDPFENNRTKIFRPKIISRRISAQAGVFTVHVINKDGQVVPLEEHNRFLKKLVKVIIPPTEFSSIRNRLHILGVNNATLFPDMDGLCSHLQWRYSRLEDEPIKRTPRLKY